MLQLAAKRELDEIKLKTAKGELHHTRDIERVFGAMLGRLRVGLLALPQGVSPLLLEQTDINEIADVLSKRLESCLTELTTFDFEDFANSSGVFDDDDDDECESEEAAEDDKQKEAIAEENV